MVPLAALRSLAEHWLQSGEAAIVVEVQSTRGSVPREAGARMLVSQQQTAGTVGGGHLELQAIEQARTMLRTHTRQPKTERYPLGPALGQCCGGVVTLGFAPLDAAALARWPVEPPMFHLQLFGAGHVGRAIAQGLAPLNVVVEWIDEREEAFPASPWPAHIRPVCVDAVEHEVARAPAGAFYLVLTHQHALDLRICEAILARGDFGFLGLIGSATKRQRFVQQLQNRGFASELIDRITCPIGLPGIAGKAPEVIAASVVAQLLMRAEINAQQ